MVVKDFDPRMLQSRGDQLLREKATRCDQDVRAFVHPPPTMQIEFGGHHRARSQAVAFAAMSQCVVEATARAFLADAAIAEEESRRTHSLQIVQCPDQRDLAIAALEQHGSSQVVHHGVRVDQVHRILVEQTGKTATRRLVVDRAPEHLPRATQSTTTLEGREIELRSKVLRRVRRQLLGVIHRERNDRVAPVQMRAAVTHREVGALDEGVVEVVGEVQVFEIGFVQGSRRQHHGARVFPAVQAAQVVASASRTRRKNVASRCGCGIPEQAGDQACHHDAVFQRIAGAGRCLGAVAEHPPALPSARARSTAYMKCSGAARRVDAAHRAQERRVAQPASRRQQVAFQQGLVAVDVVDDGVQQFARWISPASIRVFHSSILISSGTGSMRRGRFSRPVSSGRYCRWPRFRGCAACALSRSSAACSTSWGRKSRPVNSVRNCANGGARPRLASIISS